MKSRAFPDQEEEKKTVPSYRSCGSLPRVVLGATFRSKGSLVLLRRAEKDKGR